MDTIKVDHKQVKMIAHRGVSGLERENTAAAFVAAGNRSHWGVETDVHVTADGQYVIIHDSQTGRVAGDDLNVEKSTLRLLRALRLTDMDGAKREDLLLPTLDEYIRICKKYGKHCVLELKEAMTAEHVKGIVEQIRQMGWLENVTFISFWMDNLKLLRQILPEQSAQFLTGDCTPDILAELEKYHLGLDICYPGLTDEAIAFLKARGLAVNVWTVDDPKAAADLIARGVDMITSNILE